MERMEVEIENVNDVYEISGGDGNAGTEEALGTVGGLADAWF